MYFMTYKKYNAYSIVDTKQQGAMKPANLLQYFQTVVSHMICKLKFHGQWFLQIFTII